MLALVFLGASTHGPVTPSGHRIPTIPIKITIAAGALIVFLRGITMQAGPCHGLTLSVGGKEAEINKGSPVLVRKKKKTQLPT